MTPVMEVHGLLAMDTTHVRQRFYISDYSEHVTLFLTGSNAIKLSADDCRYLAKQLILAARRLEQRLTVSK